MRLAIALSLVSLLAVRTALAVCNPSRPDCRNPECASLRRCRQPQIPPPPPVDPQVVCGCTVRVLKRGRMDAVTFNADGQAEVLAAARLEPVVQRVDARAVVVNRSRFRAGVACALVPATDQVDESGLDYSFVTVEPGGRAAVVLSGARDYTSDREAARTVRLACKVIGFPLPYDWNLFAEMVVPGATDPRARPAPFPQAGEVRIEEARMLIVPVAGIVNG